MGMEVFLQEEPKIPGAHKPFPAPELRAENFANMRIFFSERSSEEQLGVLSRGLKASGGRPKTIDGSPRPGDRKSKNMCRDSEVAGANQAKETRLRKLSEKEFGREFANLSGLESCRTMP